jgi:hypothetical protein
VSRVEGSYQEGWADERYRVGFSQPNKELLKAPIAAGSPICA